MKALWWVVLLAGAARAEVGVVEGPIVDGRRGGAGDIRATVAVLDAGGDSFCTGTLIAPRVVVTAAHCVVHEDDNGRVTGVMRPAELGVVAGVVDVNQAGGSQRYAVTRVVPHEGYPNDSASSHPSGAGRFDDVALLILDRAVSGMTPAVIPSVDAAMARLSRGVEVTITGYGATSPNTEDSGVLYTAVTPFVVRANAEIVLGGRGNPDTCPGDSGGPAYLLGDPLWLVGVTSRAGDDAVEACGEGGVYGFAPFYRGWFASKSQGLYTADGEPATPVTPDPPDPDDECDPWEDEDCYECDPWEDEDCYECDPDEAEDCEYEDDEGCAGGGTPGALAVSVLALRALGTGSKRNRA